MRGRRRSQTWSGRSSSWGSPVSEKPVTVTTTRERLEALRQYLLHEYLGHSKTQEQVRALLADIEKALGL